MTCYKVKTERKEYRDVLRKALLIAFMSAAAILFILLLFNCAVFAEEAESEESLDIIDRSSLKNGLAKVIYDLCTALLRAIMNGLSALKEFLLGSTTDMVMQKGTGTTAYLCFNFNVGNVYGILGAASYSILRGFAYLILTTQFIYSVVRAIIGVSTGEQASQLKESFMNMCIAFIMMALLPSLLISAIDVRNSLLETIITRIYGSGNADIDETILSVSENAVILGAFVYIAYFVFCFKLAFDYVLIAISNVIGLMAFPICMILGGNGIKQRLQNWIVLMAANLLTPCIDTLLLAIPMMIMSNTIQGVSPVPRAMALVAACWAMQPARQWFLRWLGLPESGAIGAAGSMLAGFKLPHMPKKDVKDSEDPENQDKEAKKQEKLADAEKNDEKDQSGGINASKTDNRDSSETIDEFDSGKESNSDGGANDGEGAEPGGDSAVDPSADGFDAANADAKDIADDQSDSDAAGGEDEEDKDASVDPMADGRAADRAGDFSAQNGINDDKAVEYVPGTEGLEGPGTEEMNKAQGKDKEETGTKDAGSKAVKNVALNDPAFNKKQGGKSAKEGEQTGEQTGSSPEGILDNGSGSKESADSANKEDFSADADENEAQTAPETEGDGEVPAADEDSVAGLDGEPTGYNGFEMGEMPDTEEGLVNMQQSIERQQAQAASDLSTLTKSKRSLQKRRTDLQQEKAGAEAGFKAKEAQIGQQIKECSQSMADMENRAAHSEDPNRALKEVKNSPEYVAEKATKAALENELAAVKEEHQASNNGYDDVLGEVAKQLEACDAGIEDCRDQSAKMQDAKASIQEARQAIAAGKGERYTPSSSAAKAQARRNQVLAGMADLDNFEDKEIYSALTPAQRADFHRQKAAKLRRDARWSRGMSVAGGAIGFAAGSMALGAQGSSRGAQLGVDVGDKVSAAAETAADNIAAAAGKAAAPIMNTLSETADMTPQDAVSYTAQKAKAGAAHVGAKATNAAKKGAHTVTSTTKAAFSSVESTYAAVRTGAGKIKQARAEGASYGQIAAQAGTAVAGRAIISAGQAINNRRNAQGAAGVSNESSGSGYESAGGNIVSFSGAGRTSESKPVARRHTAAGNYYSKYAGGNNRGYSSSVAKVSTGVARIRNERAAEREMWQAEQDSIMQEQRESYQRMLESNGARRNTSALTPNPILDPVTPAMPNQNTLPTRMSNTLSPNSLEFGAEYYSGSDADANLDMLAGNLAQMGIMESDEASSEDEVMIRRRRASEAAKKLSRLTDNIRRDGSGYYYNDRRYDSEDDLSDALLESPESRDILARVTGRPVNEAYNGTNSAARAETERARNTLRKLLVNTHIRDKE